VVLAALASPPDGNLCFVAVRSRYEKFCQWELSSKAINMMRFIDCGWCPSYAKLTLNQPDKVVIALNRIML
jgi:predicted metal-binding protein